MTHFLETIRISVEKRLKNSNIEKRELENAVKTARQPHSFLNIFESDNTISPKIIAEIKFASPSEGKLHNKINPIEIANDYLTNGASALSILTEPDFFHGSLNYLNDIRQAFPHAKILMKDFIIDELQLLQARLYGADAVLLIVAFLSKNELINLYEKAVKLGLTPLVEVHNLDELKIAQEINAKLIGVNNRNLKTLIVDLSTSTQLIQHATKKAIFISESGIKTHAELTQLQHQGYQGFLIGSHFMKSESPGKSLFEMINGTQHE